MAMCALVTHSHSCHLPNTGSLSTSGTFLPKHIGNALRGPSGLLYIGTAIGPWSGLAIKAVSQCWVSDKMIGKEAETVSQRRWLWRALLKDTSKRRWPWRALLSDSAHVAKVPHTYALRKKKKEAGAGSRRMGQTSHA